MFLVAACQSLTAEASWIIFSSFEKILNTKGKIFQSSKNFDGGLASPRKYREATVTLQSVKNGKKIQEKAPHSSPGKKGKPPGEAK